MWSDTGKVPRAANNGDDIPLEGIKGGEEDAWR